MRIRFLLLFAALLFTGEDQLRAFPSRTAVASIAKVIDIFVDVELLRGIETDEIQTQIAGGSISFSESCSHAPPSTDPAE